MKKLSLFMLIVMLAAGWFRWGAEQKTPLPNTDIELLHSALLAAGAQPQGGEIHAWAQISEGYYSLLQIEAAVEIIAQEFGLNRHEYDIKTRSTGQYSCANMECTLSDGVFLRLAINSLAAGTVAEASVYQCKLENIALHFSHLETAFAATGAKEEDVKITSCLEGSLDARLRGSEKINIVYTAFKSVAAVYRGAIEAKGVSQWSGWSAHFAGSADTGEKQVNFGISLRWDVDNEKTIIRVATPVLPSSY